ncbi:MAG TPA: diguanylate cyclase [Thermoleophilia bacterium]|nr:diguanylate cyclase [Thermoleophilia bacterium]
MRLGSELRASSRIGDVVRAIAAATVDAFGFNEATVYLLEAEKGVYRAYATVGRYPEVDRQVLETPVPVEVFERLLAERFQVGEAYFIDHRDYSWSPDDLRYFPVPEVEPPEDEGEWHPDDSLFVPLYDEKGGIMGVLDLWDPRDRKVPTLERIRPLEVFATHAALAVTNARHSQELEAATRQLEQQLEVRHDLFDLSEVLLSTLDQRAVLEQIAETLNTLVDYDTMDIRVVDEARGELVAIFARDANAELMLAARVPLAGSVSGWAVTHKEALLINDMSSDPRAFAVPETPTERQASIVVPLQVMGKVSGVLSLDRLGGRTFDEHELELVRLFGNQAAIAIQNARSYMEMERQAVSDGLTGLHNHRHFQESLAAEVSRAERYGEEFCLLMMDLDHFKSVNDTVGHQRGDEVLREVAAALKRCSRESDYLARYGGEEFAVILPRTPLKEARTVAQRVCDQVREIDSEGQGVRVSMSIGVAAFPESARDKDALLGAADSALLCAKALGRDRVCTYGAREERGEPGAGERLARLGREFARYAGLGDEEAAGLAVALGVVESRGDAGADVERLPAGDGRSSRPEDRRGRVTGVPRHSAALAALLYVNERWDGAGYPEGLSGERIPRVARAFAVVRAFVLSGGGEGAWDLLRAGAGREFDPRFVDRLMSFIKETQDAWIPSERPIRLRSSVAG